MTEDQVDDATEPGTQGGEPAPSGPAATEPPIAPGEARAPASRARVVRGTIAAVVGCLVPAFVMATDRPWRFSVAVGVVSLTVAVWGILEAIGSFEIASERVAASVAFKDVRGPLVEVLAAGVVLVAMLSLGVLGSMPRPMLASGLGVTASFLWVVVSVFRLGRAIGVWRTDEDGAPRSLLRRHGFWLVLLTTLAYLPMLGSYSLSDPWETHYGEVAREMIARDDWISLWWAQDGWFWSKPILNFWAQGLFFSLLGVRCQPDQMLAGAGDGHFPQPEWAARFPVFLLALVGAYLLYRACARAFGRRAGFLGGLVLLSTPYWYFIAHQTMTDMPYVGPLCGAVALFLMGFQTDPERQARAYEIGFGSYKLRLTGYHLVLAAVLLAAIPQILYLATRNITWQIVAEPHGFRWHWDEFWSGSGGRNCGLPGNQACAQTVLPFAWPWDGAAGKTLQPGVGALLWTFVLAAFVKVTRGESRVQRLYFLAAWFFVALAAMGKGAPGLVIPLFVVGAFVGATKRWRDLTRVELAGGVLLVLCVAIPWYLQMYARHGQPFTDRLLFHDMYKRAFVHVHDTNTGDDVSFRYYVWQLGYGLFPWTGLVAGGLLWRLRHRMSGSPAGEASALLILWFVTAFAMFTISLTKFHHYIFPAVPPAAMLTGVLLDRVIGGKLADRGYLPAYVVGIAAGTLLLVYGIFRLLPGSIIGSMIEGKPPAASPALGIACFVVGAVLILSSAFLFGGTPPEPIDRSASDGRRAAADSATIGALAIASAVAVGLAARDLVTTNAGDTDGQARLMQLFTYNYRRPWPSEALDFTAVIIAFSLVAIGLCLVVAVRAWRRHAVVALSSLGFLWAAWGVNVYLVKASPHWGQRETILAYYANRKSADEWLVAYQMNWKGENFYAGNRVPAFVSSGDKFKQFIQERKDAGAKVMFFTTEHGRVGSLKSEIGNPKEFEILTDKVLNNKFFLARAAFDGQTGGAPASSATTDAVDEVGSGNY